MSALIPFALSFPARPVRRVLRLAAAAALACASAAAAAQQPQSLPVRQLRAGMYLIQAEVASTEQTRELGLMFRERLAPNHGMLFIFDQPGTQCMWMRNTLIPLSVAFIGDDGAIVNIEDMAPQTENSHCAARPVRYALEMDAGWFAKRGFKAGSKLEGIPGVR
ncbi:DUF192 domain-containing protein [Pigmentiphaga soli]|uniref:DUF192 domain-containing protein n=1 Tax=Pigmentiphaga soli TaxID=1007095 RepID=A0ABP8HI51_9BURK